ncbi:MAG: hypothetical protein ACE5KH_04085 [Candidatus Geothermarchaeales archaeon]
MKGTDARTGGGNVITTDTIAHGFAKPLKVTVQEKLVDVAEITYAVLDWEGSQEWEERTMTDVVLRDVAEIVNDLEKNKRVMVREVRVPDGHMRRTVSAIERVMRYV